MARRSTRSEASLMAAPPPSAPLTGFDFAALSATLEQLGADAWLLFDFRGVNPIAARVLDVHGMATRRYFVFLPRSGRPVAVAHRIELAPFERFPGDVRPYAAWRELQAQLEPLVRGKTLALETSPQDGVPYLDRVPHGVVQLLESLGGRVVSSAPRVTRFAARWSGAELARGTEVRETTLPRRVVDAFDRAGLVTDHPPIAAFGPNAANPHYEPRAGADRRLAPDEVLLLDLWAGVTRDAVFADQTWMAFAGRTPPEEVTRVWAVVRDARDAAVARLAERWRAAAGGGAPVTGADLDDAARGVITAAGYGEWFVHRTGHSIDRDLHGSGPHLDNFETADTRELLPGIGFSVEPGIYLPGRFGVRSEINVHLGDAGPEVTPAAPQRELQIV